MNELQMKELREAVEHQAKMESLWLMNPTITEAMLMAALRHLHAIIEGDEEIIDAVKAEYWNLESEL